ncbi:DUF3108 domain-containing protein [Luteimonas sp. A277]
MRHFTLLLTLLLILPIWALPDTVRAAEPEPFFATYEAWYGDRHVGEASMKLERREEPNWEIELEIRANRGLIGLARLNMLQSTVFDVHHDGHFFRPLTQRTVRKAILFGRNSTGIYDWHTRTAQWSGDVSERRSQPVPLQDGDMSALLINLAVIRDVEPGATLRYRYVDNGRAREHEYQVAEEPESIRVADIGYSALRVSRIDDDDDEMVVWVANGVPTPIRILQIDGDGTIDLRLIEYRGTE